MKILKIDKNSEQSYIKENESAVSFFLKGMDCDYPGFDKWLQKVFFELNDGSRIILIAMHPSIPDKTIGVAILKQSSKENKICTLRVSPDMRNKGVGTALMEKSIGVLNDKRLLITVSENYIAAFKPFLKKFGFKLCYKVKSLYNPGVYEYFFYKQFEHKKVLLSIKPKYANCIFDGRKKVEFRKACFSDTVENMYIYSSSPVKKIIGKAKIMGIDRTTVNKLWDKYHHCGCIDEESFFEYYKGKEVGYGIKLFEVKLFDEPIDPQVVFGPKFTPPQNFIYADNIKL